MFLDSRRTFLKSTFLTTAVLVMSGSELFGAVSPLQTLDVVQEDLFPHVKRLGIDSSLYLTLILNHSRVTDEDKKFIRNGVQWLNEEAVLQHKQTYIKLSETKRQHVLKIIAKERWGKNWIDTMLTYLMEAILGDPIYGANKNGAGWKWLDHTSGLPRPTKAYM